LIQAIIIGGLLEFYNLSNRRKFYPKKLLGCLFALIIGATFYFDQFPFLLGFTLITIIAFIYFVVDTNSLEKLAIFPGSFSITVSGVVYVSLTINFFTGSEEISGYSGFTCCLPLSSLEIPALFLIGKKFGRHKMTPIASPNKTWEGAIGGIIWAVAGGWLARTVLLPRFPLLEILVLSAVVHAGAQVADPLESLFKKSSWR